MVQHNTIIIIDPLGGPKLPILVLTDLTPLQFYMCVSSYFAHYRWLHIYLITLIASRNLYDVSDKHANEHNINLVMRLHLRNYFELKCLRESNETFVGPPMQQALFWSQREADIFHCKTQSTQLFYLLEADPGQIKGSHVPFLSLLKYV